MFSPYGTARYTSGTLNTAKGFTGQYNDSLTGLDYFNARYYDPVVGVFLSADKAQGNLQGMNPYAYVQGNPETYRDPTGRYMATIAPISQKGGAVGYAIPGTDILTTVINSGYVGSVTSLSGQVTASTSNLIVNTFTRAKQAAYDSSRANTSSDTSLSGMLRQTWDGLKAFWMNLTTRLSISGNDSVACAGMLSFSPATKVATAQGAKAIGSLHLGERVWAYNPKTHKMELEPVLHIWINHDYDLVDVTIAFITPTQHSKSLQKTSETVHTNEKHPFLTLEKGFVPVSQLYTGMHVISANGSFGLITSLKLVAGNMTMYNLEVAQDHTFTVGDGKWIVHNCGGVDDSTFDNSFKGLEGASYEQIMARIPQGAKELGWNPVPNGAYFGQKWTWTDGPYKYTLEMHGIDLKAVRDFPDSNAAQGWVFRVFRSGNGEGGYYMDRYGNWHPQQETDPENVSSGGRMVSPKGEYDPNVANDTHIPMEDPWDSYFDGFLP